MNHLEEEFNKRFNKDQKSYEMKWRNYGVK